MRLGNHLALSSRHKQSFGQVARWWCEPVLWCAMCCTEVTTLSETCEEAIVQKQMKCSDTLGLMGS